MNNICMVVYTRMQRVFILEVNIFKCVLLLGQLEIKILHTLRTLSIILLIQNA